MDYRIVEKLAEFAYKQIDSTLINTRMEVLLNRLDFFLDNKKVRLLDKKNIFDLKSQNGNLKGIVDVLIEHTGPTGHYKQHKDKLYQKYQELISIHEWLLNKKMLYDL